MTDAVDRYLALLELTLTGAIFDDVGYEPGQEPELLDRYDPERRLVGRDWPRHAHTMIGLTRLRHLRRCVEVILSERVPGDFIETGAWRGGACIFMRAILAVHDARDRRVWVADSFEGLPAPAPDQYPADAGSWFHESSYLAVPLEEVQRSFAKYGLLDDQVVFLKGWFKDTLPAAPIERLALLRLDGDMYASTMEALEALYDKVSVNGFVIVDDYNLDPCRKAVTEFRARRNIDAAMEDIDLNAAFWRKTEDAH